MEQSGQFRFTAEVLHSSKEEWKLKPDQFAERLVKLGLTFGHVQLALREKVITDEDVDKIMAKVQSLVRSKFKDNELEQEHSFVVIWNYRIRCGIK